MTCPGMMCVLTGARGGMDETTRVQHRSGMPHTLAGGDSGRTGHQRRKRQDQYNRQMPNDTLRRVHIVQVRSSNRRCYRVLRLKISVR